MTSLYYGEIKPERLITWTENSDPYDILVERKEITPKAFFQPYMATEICCDEVKVDWGSFAYKCSKEQLIKLSEVARMNIDGIDNLKDDVIYGLVWVEDY